MPFSLELDTNDCAFSFILGAMMHIPVPPKEKAMLTGIRLLRLALTASPRPGRTSNLLDPTEVVGPRIPDP